MSRSCLPDHCTAAGHQGHHGGDHYATHSGSQDMDALDDYINDVGADMGFDMVDLDGGSAFAADAFALM